MTSRTSSNLNLSYSRCPRFFVDIVTIIEAIRQLLLNGASLADVSRSVLALGAFVLVLFPAGLAAFSSALSYARREGSLTHS
jgi:hypothetical protein